MHAPKPTDSARKPVILVVDDEANFRSGVVRQLKKAGFETMEAADGSEAIFTFAEHNEEIDAVLLDLVMPVTNGREAMRLLRYYSPNLPIVLTTGYQSAEAARIQQDERFVGFLAKPFDAADLAREMGRIIEERERDWDVRVTPKSSLKAIASSRNPDKDHD